MKDPAVLFYFQDFLVGTEFMSDDEVGKYIRILCHQADKGALTHQQLRRICGGEVPIDIMCKLRQDADGNYYQERMRMEREKRISYSESRRKNRSKDENICKTYDKHMGNEDENINEDINEIESVIVLYHDLCEKMPKVLKLQGKRKGFVNARIKEYGIEKVTEVLRKAGQSDFLNGKNDRAWKADFEWIMRPENFLKILEGKYDNHVRRAGIQDMSAKELAELSLKANKYE